MELDKKDVRWEMEPRGRQHSTWHLPLRWYLGDAMGSVLLPTSTLWGMVAIRQGAEGAQGIQAEGFRS